MTRIVLILFTLFSGVFSAAATMDNLAQKTFVFKSDDAANVVARMAANIKGVLAKYHPQFNDQTTIAERYTLTGTEDKPVFQITVIEHWYLLNPKVALYGAVSLREINGDCPREYLLFADLSRSSALLADSYNGLQVAVCFRPIRGGGRIEIKAQAQRSSGYTGGPIDSLVFNMLLLQVDPMTEALQESLK